MINVTNKIFLLLFKISNKLLKLFNIKRRFYFSSKEILEKNFPENNNFTFIQIGANDGKSFDFLFDFVVKRKSSGVVLEPVKEYFEELNFNYSGFPNIIKINKAAHPTEKKVVINRINPSAVQKYPDWAKGIASLDQEHHKKTGIDSNDIIEEEVDADTLMNLINANIGTQKVDYFQVDTEGFDFEVIKMLDFDCLKPDIIKYESINLDKFDNERLILLLKKYNYFLFSEFGDTVAINLKNIKLY